MKKTNIHTDDKKDCHQSENKTSHCCSRQMLDKIYVYKPLIIIVIFCLLLSYAQVSPFELKKFMNYVMGYFFIFLSLFKFFDLKSFVEGFSTYDLMSRRFPLYGHIYPFIEFLLGVAYLAQFQLYVVNIITVIIMTISGAGVLKSILSGQKIKCACLATVLNVPLSTVSLLENFGMGVMAACNLIYLF